MGSLPLLVRSHGQVHEGCSSQKSAAVARVNHPRLAISPGVAIPGPPRRTPSRPQQAKDCSNNPDGRTLCWCHRGAPAHPSTAPPPRPCFWQVSFRQFTAWSCGGAKPWPQRSDARTITVAPGDDRDSRPDAMTRCTAPLRAYPSSPRVGASRMCCTAQMGRVPAEQRFGNSDSRTSRESLSSMTWSGAKANAASPAPSRSQNDVRCRRLESRTVADVAMLAKPWRARACPDGSNRNPLNQLVAT
jgi:hypothetical protein